MMAGMTVGVVQKNCGQRPSCHEDIGMASNKINAPFELRLTLRLQYSQY